MRTLSLLLLLITIPLQSTLASTTGADIDTLRAEAVAATAEGHIEAAIAKFSELLTEAPDDGASHYRLATLLMDNDGNLEEAITHFAQAAELGFQPSGAGYRVSRIYARTGETEKALAQIETIAAAGFAFFNLFESQTDFESISWHPRYLAALEKIRAARFPCDFDPRHKAFDFWIGEWIVSVGGQFAGTNDIQPILGHCVLFEQWIDANGGKGKSFNYYDPGRDHWRQIWIGDSGSFIEFTGKARDGGIYYTAETINPADGSATQHKFEFTRNGDGNVRQFWQTSTDAGETWTTIWDGLYERQSEVSD